MARSAPATVVDSLRHGWVFSSIAFVITAVDRAVPRQGSTPARRARTTVDESAPATVHCCPSRARWWRRATSGALTAAPLLLARLARGRARPARGGRRTPCALAAGEVLFQRGRRRADGLYVVKAGRLDVLVSGPRSFGRWARASVIGELALLTGGVRSATIRARRDSRLLRVSQRGVRVLGRSTTPTALGSPRRTSSPNSCSQAARPSPPRQLGRSPQSAAWSPSWRSVQERPWPSVADEPRGRDESLAARRHPRPRRAPTRLERAEQRPRPRRCSSPRTPKRTRTGGPCASAQADHLVLVGRADQRGARCAAVRAHRPPTCVLVGSPRAASERGRAPGTTAIVAVEDQPSATATSLRTDLRALGGPPRRAARSASCWPAAERGPSPTSACCTS